MTSDFSVANAVFSIFTICASGFVGFLSARRIGTINTRSQACVAFRAAFAPICLEIRRANGRPSVALDSLLEATQTSTAIACEVFAVFVPEVSRTAFEAARKEYEEAAYLGSEFIHKDARLAEIKRRVDRLLAHALPI